MNAWERKCEGITMSSKPTSENGTRPTSARAKRRPRSFADRAARRKQHSEAKQAANDPVLLASFVATEVEDATLRKKVFGW
jgi:hypothetical protein